MIVGLETGAGRTCMSDSDSLWKTNMGEITIYTNLTMAAVSAHLSLTISSYSYTYACRSIRSMAAVGYTGS
jgi:hypothetical protein